jgi:hypothetical protein
VAPFLAQLSCKWMTCTDTCARVMCHQIRKGRTEKCSLPALSSALPSPSSPAPPSVSVPCTMWWCRTLLLLQARCRESTGRVPSRNLFRRFGPVLFCQWPTEDFAQEDILAMAGTAAQPPARPPCERARPDATHGAAGIRGDAAREGF